MENKVFILKAGPNWNKGINEWKPKMNGNQSRKQGLKTQLRSID